MQELVPGRILLHEQIRQLLNPRTITLRTDRFLARQSASIPDLNVRVPVRAPARIVPRVQPTASIPDCES